MDSKSCVGLAVELGLVEPEAGALARLAPDEDVLGHRQVRHQVEFLMDHADAQVERGAWVGDLDFLPLVEDAPGVFVIDPCQHLHQGGFARAVLADQGVNFAGP